MNEPTYRIEEPDVPKVRCVFCEETLPQYQAWKVTVTRMQDFPGYPHYQIFSSGRGELPPLWQHTESTWHPSLTAAAPAVPGPVNYTPTHLVHTYVGYACSHDHAEQGVKCCPAYRE